MTSDRFRFHNNNKERGKTGRGTENYIVGKDRGKTFVIKVRGDKFIRYVIPHRGITGEVPRSFPDLFLTLIRTHEDIYMNANERTKQGNKNNNKTAAADLPARGEKLGKK